MATYDQYLSKYIQNYQPQIDKAVADQSAVIADRGLSNSTAGISSIADTGNQMRSTAYLNGSTLAENARQFDSNNTVANKTLSESIAARKQNNMISGQNNLWNYLSTTAGLSAKQKKKAPVRYSASYKRALIGDPIEQSLIGDPKEQLGAENAVQHTAAELGGNYDGETYLQRIQNEKDATRTAGIQSQANSIQAAANERSAANAAAQLAWAKEQKNTSKTNPMDTANALMLQMQTAGKALPTQILGAVQANTGLDMLGRAKSGDMAAVGFIKALYPKTWKSRIDGTASASSRQASSASTSVWSPVAGESYASELGNAFGAAQALSRGIGQSTNKTDDDIMHAWAGQGNKTTPLSFANDALHTVLGTVESPFYMAYKALTKRAK